MPWYLLNYLSNHVHARSPWWPPVLPRQTHCCRCRQIAEPQLTWFSENRLFLNQEKLRSYEVCSRGRGFAEPAREPPSNWCTFFRKQKLTRLLFKARSLVFKKTAPKILNVIYIAIYTWRCVHNFSLVVQYIWRISFNKKKRGWVFYYNSYLALCNLMLWANKIQLYKNGGFWLRFISNSHKPYLMLIEQFHRPY
jgi:hypothetical protein